MFDRAAIFYYVARVVGRGEPEPVDLTDRVISFQFTDREGGVDKLSLTVDNKDLSNFDDPVFEFGAKLRIAWGNGRGPSPLQDMVIRKVTGGRQLRVEAVTKQGALLDTLKRRRRFESVRRSDVVRTIAKENGFLEPDIEETVEIFDSIAQSNLTDGQLLRKLAVLEGFEFYVDAFGLHWHRRRVGQAPIRRYIYFTDPEGGDIIDFSVENDVTRRPGKVTVKSRDPIAKTDIEASASNSEDKSRDVLAEYTGTIDGESGDFVVDKAEVAQETTVASNVQTQEDAVAEAKGKYRRTAQRAVKLNLQLRGDPTLQAKTVIEVVGLGKRISGKYYVREVDHTLDASGGYTMNVKCITDGFQGGRGKGKGSFSEKEEAFASLAQLAEELRQAAAQDVQEAFGVIDGETGQFEVTGRGEGILRTANSLADAIDSLAIRQGGDLTRAAAALGEGAQRLSSIAGASGATNTAGQASIASATLFRIAEAPQEVEALGNKNTKELNESPVRPVKTLDTDGREVTVYENTGGREYETGGTDVGESFQ